MRHISLGYFSIELGYRNPAQTDQLNPSFDTFADLVNRVGMWQNNDWLVPNSDFSPTVGGTVAFSYAKL